MNVFILLYICKCLSRKTQLICSAYDCDWCYIRQKYVIVKDVKVVPSAAISESQLIILNNQDFQTKVVQSKCCCLHCSVSRIYESTVTPLQKQHNTYKNKHIALRTDHDEIIYMYIQFLPQVCTFYGWICLYSFIRNEAAFCVKNLQNTKSINHSVILMFLHL